MSGPFKAFLRQQSDGTLSWIGRVLYALPIAGMIAAVYHLAGHPVRPPLHPQTTFLDQQLPFIPASIYIYMPGYILCFVVTLWVIEQGRAFRSALMALVTINALAVPFFVFFPVPAPRPALEGPLQGSLVLVQHLYQNDTLYNTFPSLHVASAALCARMVYCVNPRVGRALMLLALLISISVLTMKQHYAIDIVGGLLLAQVGFLSWRLGMSLDPQTVSRLKKLSTQKSRTG